MFRSLQYLTTVRSIILIKVHFENSIITIKIGKSKKEIQLTCMFSYKASWLQILTPWLQHAYLVTWKRGALMPTRTTIFFCSTSRSTRGRWQPVQVFFFGSKLNQTQHWRMCSRVLPDFLPKILSFSRGQKFALMNCVSEQMTFLWSFSEFFASISSLREQAFLFFLFSPVFMVQQQCKRWFSFCRLFLEPLFHSMLLNYIPLASFDLNNWHT